MEKVRQMKISLVVALRAAVVVISTGGLLMMDASASTDHHDHGAMAHPIAENGIGQKGSVANKTRTITVEMTDSMRFTPSRIQVGQNETIELVIKNLGKLKHELVLGTATDLKAHAAAMRKHPDMVHEDDNMVTVEPQQSQTLVWQFSKPGVIHFACLQPGHYEAGMKGTVSVTKPTATKR